MAKKPAAVENSTEKPEPSLSDGLWGCGIVIGLGLAITALFTQCSGESMKDTESTNTNVPLKMPAIASTDQLVAFKATPRSAKRGTKCAGSGLVTQTDFDVRREHVLLTEPRADAKELKARIAGAVFPATIDGDFDVREVCRLGKWSEVRILVPQDFRGGGGWVPTSVLSAVKTGANGRRVYTSGDFEWPAGMGGRRASVVKAINRIIAERPDCEAIDRSSFIMASDGPNPTFMVGCTGDDDYQMLEFTAQDAANGRSFASYEPIDKGVAFGICKDAARTKMNNPSTFEMSPWTIDFRDGGDGRTQIMSSFSARNAFNLELTFDVVCDFTGETLTDVRISQQ